MQNYYRRKLVEVRLNIL